MKHLIIFLNYCRSRLDNPVYRIFSKEIPSRRNTTLLFLPRPLEERELLHEVSDLRRKEKSESLSDVSFHICADFERQDEGECLSQTIRLIKRLFPADEAHLYKCFAYVQLPPEISSCSEKQVKSIWNNLANINNASTEYSDFSLIDKVYLYSDQTQHSLGDFLFETIHSDIKISELCGSYATDNCGSDTNSNGGDQPSSDKGEWPPIFATFNATGITYPEKDVREYLHRKYVCALLQCSLNDVNPVSTEVCNNEAKRIISFIPIQNSRICLQEDSFIATDEHQTNWKPVESFWKNAADIESQGMNDIPHDEWLNKIRQRLDVIYQSRFRDIGVEYFFQLQAKKTSSYVQILQSIINQEFISTIQNHPYTPEAQKTIVRSIINILQQKVLELQQLQAETESAIRQSESLIAGTVEKWDGLSLFSRLMKKDASVLASYTEQIGTYFTQKTLLFGQMFAIKLLNELIPMVSALSDKADEMRKTLDSAIHLSSVYLQEADPSNELGRFSKQQVENAATLIGEDADYFISHYQQLVQLFFINTPINDGDDLLARVNTTMSAEIDQYIDSRISGNTLPPVLNQTITDRMSALYSDRGGLSTFINVLKERTQFNLSLKVTDNNGHYMLVTPSHTGQEDIEHIMTSEVSHIEMLHILQGIRLTDLDGFSGQRMFIEPTLF